MAFPNQGQTVASTLPSRRPLPVKKAAKKPALDPRMARQTLLAGMKGC